jgi:hypothetical protein
LVIKYRLGFADKSEDYAYLCAKILGDSKATFNVIKTDDEIIIFLEGDEEELKRAFLILGESLPLSLYLNGQSVEDAIGMPQNKTEFKKVSYLAMQPRLTRELIDENSAMYFDVFGVSIGEKDKKITANGKNITDKSELKKVLSELVTKIKNKESVSFKNERNSFSLSLNPSDNVFFTNLRDEAISVFDLSADDILTLSSLERPMLLKLNNETKRFLSFIFPNDTVMFLFAKLLGEQGINALFVDVSHGDFDLEYFGFLGDAPKRKALYFAGADRFFVNEDFVASGSLASENSLFFDMNVSSEFGVYAISQNEKLKKLTKSDFFTSNPLDGLKKEFDFGAKLAENFEAAFPEAAKKLSAMDYIDAMEDFFNAAAAVLGEDGGFESIVALANGTDVAGGVKLDFLLQKNENGTVLSLKKCFASLLSYKLAGVSNDILAYSIFESAVDFIVSALDEAKKSFEAKEMFVGGDFLLSKVFVSKLKSKVKSMNINMALNALPKNLQKSYEIVA